MMPAAAAVWHVLIALLIPSISTADPIRDSQWHVAYLNLARAQEFSQGDGVTVAVIDTGVDGDHPDLSGSFVSGTDLTFEGPGDGLVDVHGHGTSTAGIIAAHGRALGIAPRAKIQSVRAGTGGLASASTGPAIDWAIDHGATVLCIAGARNDDPVMRDAVSRARAVDIVVVAAAGNRPEDKGVRFPAAYPGVIAVSGIDRNGEHADISVTGPEIVLAAPAVDIMTTYLRDSTYGGYAPVSGTSAATAIVAGAAALVRSKYPNLSAAEVVHRLTATADDKGPPGRDHEYGYGVVNLVKALTADVPPLPPTAAASSPNATAATSPSMGGGTTGGSRSALLIGLAVIGILIALGGYLVWRRQAQS